MKKVGELIKEKIIEYNFIGNKHKKEFVWFIKDFYKGL